VQNLGEYNNFKVNPYLRGTKSMIHVEINITKMNNSTVCEKLVEL